jgi:hypothetical protein|tara:strand:- start:15054 stop:15494 length:441 start_codon:yes stop_codon:yes gene_type:complete
MFTPCADVEIVTYLGYQTGVLIDEKHAIALHTVFGPVDPEAIPTLQPGDTRLIRLSYHIPLDLCRSPQDALKEASYCLWANNRLSGYIPVGRTWGKAVGYGSGIPILDSEEKRFDYLTGPLRSQFNLPLNARNPKTTVFVVRIMHS